MTTTPADQNLHTIADLQLWVITVIGILVLLALDFIITRRPHAVEMKEAIGWSAFYIALPLALGTVGVLGGHGVLVQVALIWLAHIGMDRALGYGLKYETAFKDTHLERV